MVLAQVATDAKSNEITAVPKLLALLCLKGTIVTADALNCQRSIAEQIVNQGGNYALALKENQPTLHADVDVRDERGSSKDPIRRADCPDASEERRNTRSRSTAFVCPARVAMPRLHKYIQYDDEPEPKTKAEHGSETEGKKRPAA